MCLYILYNIIYLCKISFASAAWQPCKWRQQGDEFDPELEPTHNGEDGDEVGMDASHGLHNEDLYDDNGNIHRHTQGTTTTSICHL